MQGNGMERRARTDISDRALWEHSCATDAAAEDDAARYLDLAAFAGGCLDPDEHERVAEWLARRPDAAQDIIAARALANAVRYEPPPEAVVARACAIVGGSRTHPGLWLAFLPRSRTAPVVRTITQWGSLAAALVIAGWFGFTLGMDASAASAQDGRAAEDGILQELLAPSPGLMRDLTGGA